MSTENERDTVIEGLEKIAKELREYKEKNPQRRPIVIEFSGSPKSGKTSCINALTVFLRRNGLRASLVQERASVCPVDDKKSPMFNIWTASSSLSDMIGILESRPVNCDVLILDRGIFDALCWFSWLNSQKNMSNDLEKNVKSFFLLSEFTKLIDIVFVFTCDVTTSIEREHANLLTKKTGSIMKPAVLGQYLKAINDTAKKHNDDFEKIVKIDTTNSSQNEVSKTVTDEALNIFQELLMERVGYILPDAALKATLLNQRISLFSDLESYLPNFNFDFRKTVEANTEYLQPIPIAVITDPSHSRVLLVKKNEQSADLDSPERDKLLPYVGGHARIEDMRNLQNIDFLSICKETLMREIKEEIGISIALDNAMPSYIIYTPNNASSDQHLAICFVVERNIDDITIKLDPIELTVNRGVSKSGEFFPVERLAFCAHELEPWGVEILRKQFGVHVTPIIDSKNQLTLFESK